MVLMFADVQPVYAAPPYSAVFCWLPPAALLLACRYVYARSIATAPIATPPDADERYVYDSAALCLPLMPLQRLAAGQFAMSLAAFHFSFS